MRFDISKEITVYGGVIKCYDCPKRFKSFNFRKIITHKQSHGKVFRFQGKPSDLQKSQRDTVNAMRATLKHQQNKLLNPYVWLRGIQDTQDKAVEGPSGSTAMPQPMKQEPRDDFFEAIQFTFEQLRPDTQTVVMRQLTDLIICAYEMDHGSTPERLQVKKEEIKEENDWDSD